MSNSPIRTLQETKAFGMYPQQSKKNRHALLRCAITATLILAMNLAVAQQGATPVVPLMEALAKAATIDEALAKLQPPVTKAQTVKSDYLLLDLPDIALAGPITVRLMSEIPGTDLFMLFDNSVNPGKPVLLAAKIIPALSKADVRVPINLSKGGELILFARANGRVYSVTREIKLAVKNRK